MGLSIFKAPIWTDGSLDRGKIQKLTGASDLELEILMLSDKIARVLDLVWTFHRERADLVKRWFHDRNPIWMGLTPIQVIGLEHIEMLIISLEKILEERQAVV